VRPRSGIDGKEHRRHTPFVDVEIGCGEHRIDFKRPDLQIAESESIVVKPGQTSNEGSRYPADPSRQRLAPAAFDQAAPAGCGDSVRDRCTPTNRAT
jgi:hypothetical protein